MCALRRSQCMKVEVIASEYYSAGVAVRIYLPEIVGFSLEIQLIEFFVPKF